MNYHVEFNEKLRIIEAKIEGTFLPNQLGSLATEIFEFSKKESCQLLLVDLRKAELPFSIMDIYKIPIVLKQIADEKNFALIQMKRAMVISSKEGNFHFLETVSFNSMQPFNCFSNEDGAREWLLSREA